MARIVPQRPRQRASVTRARILDPMVMEKLTGQVCFRADVDEHEKECNGLFGWSRVERTRSRMQHCRVEYSVKFRKKFQELQTPAKPCTAFRHLPFFFTITTLDVLNRSAVLNISAVSENGYCNSNFIQSTKSDLNNASRTRINMATHT